MSTRSSTRRRKLRQKLDKALYDYVIEKNRLPSSIRLMKYANVEYMQSRKFIRKKKDNNEWSIEKIKASRGKTIKTTIEKKEEIKTDEEEPTGSGNLLTDSVVKATKEAVKEAKKKAEEATPSQEEEVGPVNVIINSSDDDGVDEKEEKEIKPKIVIRKALRSMNDDEQNRFFDAIDTMLKAKNGPGTSEFFRLASYHGYPRPIYCQHGRETFPGWHRIYLQQFELAIQVADKENGNDGNISLPYWDWTTKPEQGLPKSIRKRFAKWPNDLFPKDVIPQYKLKRDTDYNIGAKLNAWGTVRSAYDCLQATQHFAHASTGGMLNYPSVETSHNHLHVIVGGNGGTMASVAWAAYDIAFWLHHNNVDRIYESYLAIEPDSAVEFETEQEKNRDIGQKDLFDLPFTPFKKPNGEYYFPADTFKTEDLGYKYDKLIKPQPMQLREAPTLVLFRQVKVYEFESKCYQIHVYVVDKDKENEFKEPTKSEEIDVRAVNYAGGDAIFGRGMECSNCMTRPPVDLYVNISKTLRDLNISRYNASIRVYIEETTDDSDKLLTLDETPLPQPVITGPFFEDLENESLDEKGEIGGPNNTNEVSALQTFLQRFGYYDDDKKIDGDYGPVTLQAVKDYQTAAGLKVDGITGPLTKKSIVNSRRCSNKDPFAKNKAVDANIGNKYGTSEVSYYIEVSPGYLARNRVEETIAAAFKEWETNCGLSFLFLDDDEIGNKEKADIILQWTSGKSSDNRLGFDGSGGILGHGGKGFVDFDISERWVYGETQDDEKELSVLSDPNTWYRGKPTVSLFYVAVHEIGHSLGLDHSMSTKDLMGPYYTPTIKTLSPNDVNRIQTLYPN